MDFFRDMLGGGQVVIRSYEIMKEVITHLEENNYSCNENIVRGSYGFVIVVKR